MKPTLHALVTLFRRHPGEWINHAIVYEAGGHRTTERIRELRALGYTLEQRGRNEASQYRLLSEPDLGYQSFVCACGWSGDDTRANHGALCPTCGRGLETVPEPLQVALL